MHVLIVGGTGSGGKSLIRHLRSSGSRADITVMSRTATALPGVKRVLRGHYADLVSSPDMGRLLADFDAVVHLADGLSILQYPPHSADVPLAVGLLAASETLARAVRDARVPLLVHVSSIKALCDEGDDRVLVEASQSLATTAYGRAKWHLERRLTHLLANSETELAILRNPVMYGPSKAGSMSRLLKLVDSPFPLPLAGLANRRSLLAIENFASALASILAADSPTGGIFHVHDGPALSTTEIVETLRSALGRQRRLFALGAFGARMAVRAPGIGPVVRRLYGSLELSDARFRRAFRWTPVVDGREALREMARSLAMGAA